MPKQEFPKYLFHKDQPVPLLVKTMAELDTAVAEGWAEDPDTAAGRPRPHPEPSADAPWFGDVAPADRARGPKVEYPKFVFNAQGTFRHVKSAAEWEALGEGWYESPDEAKAATATALATTPIQAADVPPLDVPPPPPPSTPSAPPPPTPKRDIQELSALRAEDLIAYIDTLTISDFEYMAEIALAEEAGKNRVTVKNAINARIDVLTRPPAPEAPPS